jgi:lipoyl(octanoyl) transferase
MQQFTLTRTEHTQDEIWITEHPPVYTLGMNAKLEHLLNNTDIPLVASDRGGQISYHGPGQLIIYILLDLRRHNIGPKQIVSMLENAIISSLRQYGVKAELKPKAPGVYVAGKKIASLGLRIKGGCCYHGLSLNNQMDLSPFLNINPCGYAGLEMTQLSEYGVNIQLHELAVPILHEIIQAVEL